MIMDKLSVAVVGFGYWGPNLVRNFNQLPDCNIKTCCDSNEDKLKRVNSLFPHVNATTNLDDVINDPAIDAVAIATPVYSHFEIAKKCLENKKHVMIEKPLASSVAQCNELIHIAEKNQKILMVGHTFEYTAAVNKIKEIIDSGELGEILCIHSSRLNLGLFQPDINVIWDLAPHDLSIMIYLLDQLPVSVNAQGKAHFKEDIQDVATVSLSFDNGTIAFLNLSWLHPDKIRKLTIVGSKKMLVYDDISPNEKIRIFDKGVEAPPYYNSYVDFHFSYRYGDINVPRIKEYEPLRYECNHFLDCIKNNLTPRSDGYSGLRVVSILEAANKSLRKDGSRQIIEFDHTEKKEKAEKHGVPVNSK